MVLQLVLHAPPDPFAEGVIGDGISRGGELCRDPVRLVLLKKLLVLMRGRDDEGRDESRHKNGGDVHARGEEGEDDGVVRHEHEEFLFGLGSFLFDGVDGDHEGVVPPEGEESREGDKEPNVLELAEGGVIFGIRCPGIEEGIRRNVFVHAHLVGERVVLVVLVAPPGNSQAGTQRTEEPQSVRPLVHPVNVIVPEPSRLRETQARQTDARKRSRVRGRRRPDRHGNPDPDQPALVPDVPFPPPLLLQLLPQQPEVLLGLRVLGDRLAQQRDALRARFGEALPHPPRLGGVEGVHDLRGVPAVVPVDPVRPGGVGLAPPAQVVPGAVDAHVQGGAALHLVARVHLHALLQVVVALVDFGGLLLRFGGWGGGGDHVQWRGEGPEGAPEDGGGKCAGDT
mmetsp:Transcript_6817/g.14184  ORF Transcript_6817/g.14184 Transcript_6817/m.14184 type:complete len:397 (+) Transcript_6817:302-1492(+)